MFAKLLIAALIIGGLAPFTFIKGKDGQPLMSFSDLKMPETKVPDISLPDIPNVSNDQTAVTPEDPEGTVYKWKDAEGNWQFSSKKPKNTEFTSTIYDQNMNVIQSVKPKRPVEKEVVAKKESPKSVNDLGSAYSPEKVEKLFDDANNIESLLNKRMKEQNKALNSL